MGIKILAGIGGGEKRMNKRRKQNLMVFSLAMLSGIIFVYLSKNIGTFLILGSLMISLFKREVYNFRGKFIFANFSSL